MSTPVNRHFTQHKLLSGYPEEVLFKLELAREFIAHIGAEPRNGLLLQGALPTPDMLSKGTARPDLAPVDGVDPPQSLGVRMWSSCQPVLDDVYGEPVGGKYTFLSPIVTMGYVEYYDDSNKEVSVNEFGQVFSRSGRMTVPLLHHLENGFKHPKEGDIVEFWARSWHELGIFYNVVKVSADGHIADTSYFTQWVLELRRNDNYVPERKLLSASTVSSPALPPLEDEAGAGDPEVSYLTEAFVVDNTGQLSYPLSQTPITTMEVELDWNGISLVPGAGFATYLPTVRGFVIQGSTLVLSSLVTLSIDDVLSIGYSYLAEG